MEFKEQDYLNFLLGKYVAFGVNDPKKYPKQQFLHNTGEQKQNSIMTPEQMEAVAKRIASKFNK